jgi:NAD(P)-dependent dehydrogenase (short-subunit alcohol dehydrogenase family)
MMSLQGQVAIVVGDNGGIGASIVWALGEQGANMLIDYFFSHDASTLLEQQVAVLGDPSIRVEAGVSQVGDLQRLIGAAVEQFGRVEIVVNNASIKTRTSIPDTTEAPYEKVPAIDLQRAREIRARGRVGGGGLHRGADSSGQARMRRC